MFGHIKFYISIVFVTAISGCVHGEGFSSNKFCLVDESIEYLPVITEEGLFLVFGEIHGTKEAPNLFLSVICDALRREDVLVALEFSNEVLSDARLVADNGPEAIIDAIDKRYQSNSSVALIELINRLFQIEGLGGNLEVAGFSNFDKDNLPESTQQVEQVYANEITKLQLQCNCKVIVLTGNFHAALQPFSEIPTLENVVPMAGLLPSSETYSFDLAHRGGTAFNCRGKECGISEIPPQYGASRRGVYLYLSANPRYSGYWDVDDVITPSLFARSVQTD